MARPNNAIPQKIDAPTFLLHWLLVLTLLVSLATGLRIAADTEQSSWAQAISGLLPQGEIIGWHI
ncbi:hypothetical protein [Pelagibius sp. Alg239-R121]|uniref:hypothetical protein n=1 Tax=Pelagibius sp. Alg239-R121 TaxID=2993448 RepID=UPI0024A6CEC4|nr:hypothetical protein [Pelagibius sp. Alg239-R121]